MWAETIPARLSAPWRRRSSARRAALRFLVLAAIGAAACYAAAMGATLPGVSPLLAFAVVLSASFGLVAASRTGLRPLLARARAALRQS